MILNKLNLVTCVVAFKGFERKKEYIFLKEEDCSRGHFIDNEGMIQIALREYFKKSREIFSKFTVYAVFNETFEHLKIHKEYSVFACDESSYLIVDENMRLCKYDKNLFFRKEVYEKYRDESVLDEKIEEANSQYKYDCRKREEINKYNIEKEKEFNEKIKKEEFLIEIISAINNGNKVSQSKKKNLNSKIVIILIVNIFFLSIFINLSITSSIVSIIILDILISIFHNSIQNYKKNRKELNFNSYQINNLQNLDIINLGKIKKIELIIQHLTKRELHNNTVKLLNESLLIISNLKNLTNQNMKKIDIFLNNILIYEHKLMDKEFDINNINNINYKLSDNILNFTNKNKKEFASFIYEIINMNKNMQKD